MQQVLLLRALRFPPRAATKVLSPMMPDAFLFQLRLLGVITNDAGRFSISVAPSTNALVVSSTGFAAREVALTGAGEVNIQLASVADNLGEVVVVAYGTRKKSDLTGAVTSIGTKEFQKGNINSAEQLLVGKVAGLSVTTGGGAAGGGSRIRIRGGASLNASNDPLIVIDGVPVEGNGIAGSANLLNTINPNDIESFTVLKDASAAALYGSRACIDGLSYAGWYFENQPFQSSYRCAESFA